MTDETIWQGPLSGEWYRVAELRPRLRAHVRVHSHVYRGRSWWVLEDRATGQQHRLDPAGHTLVELLNGDRTLDAAWNRVAQSLGDDAPTQDETIALLGKLHGADLIQCELRPDVQILFERGRERRRKTLGGRFRNPLALRIPLLDPDRLLDRVGPAVMGVFSVWGAAAWLLLVIPALVLAANQWEELSADLAGRVLAPGNLLLVGLVFPAMKAVHELAHALAVKRWGGEVHEAGFMLLVLLPIPYVDASAASAFPSKRRRMLVGAAGMMAELLLAALALALWILAEPGIVRDLAWNMMLIACISVLLFNGNPLMRFDGYYILADAIEIPNLATRANGYLRYLVQCIVLGMADAQSPLEGPDERAWLLGYGIAAFAYRVFLTLSIALFLAEAYPLFGAGLALFAVATQILWPCARGLLFLLRSPRLARRRTRALVGATSVMGAVTALLLVPAPTVTIAQGMLWPARDSIVRSEGDGFVAQVLRRPGTQVQAGDLLLRLEDPIKEADLKVLEARLEALERRLQAELREDRVKAELTGEEVRRAERELFRARERSQNMLVRAPVSGTYVVPGSPDLEGRYIAQGQRLAQVLGDAPVRARVVVSQQDVGRIRRGVRQVRVRLAGHGETLDARILREIPGGRKEVPSPALGSALGGEIEVTGQDEGATATVARVFQFELELPIDGQDAHTGSRLHARFEHAREPIWQQMVRATRQVFLERLAL